MLGKTFLILVAITFDIIFASTLTRDIGRQFSSNNRSFPFFSIRVIVDAELANHIALCLVML